MRYGAHTARSLRSDRRPDRARNLLYAIASSAGSDAGRD
jgi:hypothetical protein